MIARDCQHQHFIDAVKGRDRLKASAGITGATSLIIIDSDRRCGYSARSTQYDDITDSVFIRAGGIWRLFQPGSS